MNGRGLLLLSMGVAAGALAVRAAGRRRTAEAAPRAGTVPQASALDTLGVMANVVVPTLAKGVIIRRPRVVAMAEKLALDRRAVRRMQQLQERYGASPVLLRLPFRRYAAVLDPGHVYRVLEETPEPFAPGAVEKQAALAHFEPRVALISHGAERKERRRFNEEVLDSREAAHRLADRFLAVAHQEVAGLLEETQGRGELTWDAFAPAWFRMIRRVIFGDSARDDRELTDMIAQLRSRANWAFFLPKDLELRDRFLARLRDYLARAEPGSLANVVARTHATGVTAPEDQVAQWLFAFDPTGMTTFRTLALLASHPAKMEQAREEIRQNAATGWQSLPYLRACVVESLRLWPTTPMVLRETTRQTEWETGVLPPRTGILIFAPFFHRDDRRLPYADRFTPELWLKGRTTQDWPLIPFSAGPGICPGRNLVLLLSSAVLAELIDEREIRLRPPSRLDADRPLPATLNNYSLCFELLEAGARPEPTSREQVGAVADAA